ncbi:hypothetical protein MPER_01183 [Moniliophthora perniciosa FA553]|nr:hypothetical protein MPER_01183 [Moniliophthora perniciosa FA553]
MSQAARTRLFQANFPNARSSLDRTRPTSWQPGRYAKRAEASR